MLHPVRHLVASLIVLAILAGCVGAIKFNYDDRKNLPADVDSNVGYAVMAQHFPVNSSIQQFILVQSPRDLRSPKALADLEQMARRVSQVPGIAAVSAGSPGRLVRPSNRLRPRSRPAQSATSYPRRRPRSPAATPISTD